MSPNNKSQINLTTQTTNEYHCQENEKGAFAWQMWSSPAGFSFVCSSFTYLTPVSGLQRKKRKCHRILPTFSLSVRTVQLQTNKHLPFGYINLKLCSNQQDLNCSQGQRQLGTHSCWNIAGSEPKVTSCQIGFPPHLWRVCTQLGVRAEAGVCTEHRTHVQWGNIKQWRMFSPLKLPLLHVGKHPQVYSAQTLDNMAHETVLNDPSVNRTLSLITGKPLCHEATAWP